MRRKSAPTIITNVPNIKICTLNGKLGKKTFKNPFIFLMAEGFIQVCEEKKILLKLTYL